MLAEGETVSKNQPRKRWHFVVLRSLLVLERGIFWLLYWLARRMESDDVFLQEDSKARSHNSYSPPNSPADMGSRINNPANNHRDRTRAISLPQVPGAKQASFNPVKDFISNIVNRKGQKKRASLKRSVTTGNVTDEKAAVRYVGRGHSFISCHLRNPTWCDCCGEFIWGLFKQCVRCKNCKYTCHRRCREDVDLDCTGGWHLERNLSVDEMTMKTLHLIDQGEKRKEPFMLYTECPTGSLLSEKIDEYNSTTTGLIMTTRGADTYQGFIRVHMNLLRPINIVAGERPLSIFETVGANKEEELKNPQRTSFFLPLGTVKALHVTSDTTVHEVIVALLKKFKVADNPRKFALFECYQEEDNHMILRRMSDIEKPLVLRLLWGGADIRHNFSLQENETGDIVWEVFSMPELQNFMKILDKEEEEHISLVQEKYRVYKERLEKALALVDEEAPDS